MNGENEYIQDITKEACELLHRYGTYNLPNAKVVTGVKPNSTVTHSIILAGSLTTEGRCSSAGYSDPYGTWESVVVQGTIKFTLNDYEAQANLDNNHVKLRSGTVCSLQISKEDILSGNPFPPMYVNSIDTVSSMKDLRIKCLTPI